MPAHDVANAVYSLTGLFVLLLIIVVFWRSYCIDAFRQDLFDLRAELFAVAADRKISFSDPYYKFLWRRINCTIRWAPKLNVIHLLVTWAFTPFYHPESCDKSVESAFQGLPVPTQERLKTIHDWMLVRITFQALHFPAILLGFARVVWGLEEPTFKSNAKVRRAVKTLERLHILKAAQLLLEEAVEARKMKSFVRVTHN